MSLVKFEDIEDKIISINNLPVIIDSEVAKLYGVETKRINEAVNNNPDKFPEGYVFALNKNDWNELKSKFSTSIKGGKVKTPNAFTEKGLYMLATILKSPKATQTTIAIIETFSKINKLKIQIRELSKVNDEKKKQTLLKKSGELMAEILDDSLTLNESETTIEINFAVLKLKHTIKRK